MVEVITREILKKKVENTHEFVECYIGYLDISYVDEMLELKDIVVESIDNPEVFVSASKEVILEDVLKPEKGMAIGVFVQNQLVAYRALKFSGKIIEKMMDKLDIPQEDIDKIVYLQSTVVHPDFRGNGLQIKTLNIMLDVVMKRGFKHVTATISPYNYYSLKNILKNDITIWEIATLGGNYGEKKRCIMYKNLTVKDQKNYQDIIAISHQDINHHMEVLQKGYIGFDTLKTEEGYNIIFGKKGTH